MSRNATFLHKQYSPNWLGYAPELNLPLFVVRSPFPSLIHLVFRTVLEAFAESFTDYPESELAACLYFGKKGQTHQPQSRCY